MKLTPTNITTLSLTTLTLLSGVILSSSLASADNDSVVDEINITVPVSCTLNGTGMTSHNAEINNGQYNSAIGETTLKAYCNDNEGFAIYAIGYTGNEEGNNVLTNSTLGSTYDIVTGTATSGNTSNWAMKLSTITSPTPTYSTIIAGTTEDTLKEQGDPDFTTFQEVPDNYTKVAYRTAGTDIGTNAEGSTLKTTYQAYISSTQPAGTYTGQVKYTLVHPYDGTAPVISRVSIDTATTLQQAEVCSSELTIGQVYTLVDSRDNEQYKVTKLADGNCWILDNLRLDPIDPTVAANLSESNTNAPAAAITNFLNGGSTATGWSSVPVSNESSGFGSFTEPQINNQYKNTIVTSFGESTGKTGVYYNYCAATVGTICYEEEPESEIESEDILYDICPANWHMPTSDQYDTLVTQYSTPGSLQLALSVSLSGGYGETGVYNKDYWGYYWSSSLNSNSSWASAYILPVDDAYNDWSGTHYRDGGDPIRCVLDSN